MAALLSIATAVPPHEFPQSEVILAAREVFAPRYSNYHLIEPVFANTGIETVQLLSREWTITDADGEVV